MRRRTSATPSPTKKKKRWPKPKPRAEPKANPGPKPFPPDRSKLRGVFFGTSEFAVPSLRAFAAALDCVLVVTQPDRPAGRGHRLAPTPVKRAAEELGIEVYAPERLRDALPRLSEARADLFAVASYGKIVPQSVLDLAPLGALNVHPSLLPLYRGATPLQSQLRDGVVAGGVTIIRMDAGMDTGDIVLQEERSIGAHETYGELHDRFARLGAEMLAEAVAQVARGSLAPRPQVGLATEAAIAATATKPLGKADLEIDWGWSSERIANHVRSLAPSPGARAGLAGERVKLLAVRRAEAPALSVAPRGTTLASGTLAPETIAPGTLLGTDGTAVLVATGSGALAVERLVPPNRDAMDGARFAQARLPA